MSIPMPDPQADANASNFEANTNIPKLREFYSNLRSFSFGPPNLIIKFDKHINNIECMIAQNLQDGLPNQALPEEPEKRAYEFLGGLADHFDIDITFLRRFLFLKHMLRSPMGYHCIFGLRQRDIEMEENHFYVHLDRAQNVVMVSAIYQAIHELDEDPSSWKPDVIERGIENACDRVAQKDLIDGKPLDKEKLIQRISREGWVWTPDWKHPPNYVLRYKIKLTTPVRSHVVLIDKNGECELYTTDAHDQPESFELGHILGSSWVAPPRPPEETNQEGNGQNGAAIVHDDRPVLPPLRKILLRDMQQNDGQLAGRYVAVEDQLSRIWPTQTVPSAEDVSSHLDRVMAFYHIHKMQSYFRQLGLSVLDEYYALNPLHVVLTGNERAAYVSAEKRIYLGKLHKSSLEKWTHARNVRTVYHECVHAITDALARLHRQDLDAAVNMRAPQLLQAAAMDEGLADYFACSMVAQDGDYRAEYRTFRYQEPAGFLWTDVCRPLDAGEMDLSIVNVYENSVDDPDIPPLKPDIIYVWCQHWARYLWLLRRQLGAEVADVLIANSIFFLHRWSSFAMGILALITADRLLFMGRNREIILNTAKIATDDVAPFYGPDGARKLDEAIEEAATAKTGFQIRRLKSDDDNQISQHDLTALDRSVADAAMMDYGMAPVGDDAAADDQTANDSLFIGEIWTD